jgi:hypothetical protein
VRRVLKWAHARPAHSPPLTVPPADAAMIGNPTAAIVLLVAYGVVGLVLVYQWLLNWRERRFQFRLVTLLAFVTLAAIVFWLLRP